MDPLLTRRKLLGALGAAAAVAPGFAAGQTYPPERVPITSTGIWPWLRAQLVLDPGISWLDTAAFGPTARAVLVRAYRQLEQQSLDYRTFSEGEATRVLRQALVTSGQFFGTDPGDLVLTGGAREGLAMLAAGIDLQPGDEVVMTAHEYPAVMNAWQSQARRRGLRLVLVPQPGVPSAPEEFMARIGNAFTARTRVLLVSHIQYTDGTVLPVRELCGLARSRGIFSIVDGAQAAGQFEPLNLPDLGCDAYATCLHKWLNGPTGTGLLYLRRDAHARVWPLQPDETAGANPPDGFGAAPTTTPDPVFVAHARYGGLWVHQAPQQAAVPLAYELQYAAQRTRIALRVRELATSFRDAVKRIPGVEVMTPKHPALALGIVSLRIPTRDSGKLAAELAGQDRIVVGHVRLAADFDVVRVSLHAGTGHDEVERCAAALQRRA
jgi:isopenicillin-N epimerase